MIMKYPRKINGKRVRLVTTWSAMKQRCYNHKNPGYIYYGAKGIIVCDEWKNNYDVFADWAYANGYTDSLTIDRIDSKKGYYPENCRWVSLSVNSTGGGLGKTRREETRNKIRTWRTGRKRQDMSGSKNIKARKIICIETGKIYPTIEDAAKEVNVTRTCISQVVRGIKKTSGGFHWKYA